MMGASVAEKERSGIPEIVHEDGEQDYLQQIRAFPRLTETQERDLAKRCGSTVSAIERINALDSEPEDEQLLLIPVL